MELFDKCLRIGVTKLGEKNLVSSLNCLSYKLKLVLRICNKY
jgi:hypothetical protein